MINKQNYMYHLPFPWLVDGDYPSTTERAGAKIYGPYEDYLDKKLSGYTDAEERNRDD